MTSKDLAILLSGVFGFLLSLAFTMFPGLSDWYYGDVGKKYRGLIMVGAGAVISTLLYLLACVWVVPIPGVQLTCGTEGILTLLMAFVAFITSNQVTYLVSPDSPAKGRVAGRG